MNTQKIPEQAVEQTARMFWGDAYFENAEPAMQDRWREDARHILAAALPLLGDGGEAEFQHKLRVEAEAHARDADRERDAYRKAKQENDERFMSERDAAVARAKTAEESYRALLERTDYLRREITRWANKNAALIVSEREAHRQLAAVKALADAPYGSEDWGLLHNGVRHIPAPSLHKALSRPAAVTTPHPTRSITDDADAAEVVTFERDLIRRLRAEVDRLLGENEELRETLADDADTEATNG